VFYLKASEMHLFVYGGIGGIKQ